MERGGGTGGKRDRYHHGDLRQNLLRIARDEIAKHGPGTMSLSSLARLAGVSQSAPYRHFADKKALLDTIAMEAFEVLTQALVDAVDDREPHTALEALALAYVEFGEANIEIYRLMFVSRLVPDALDGSALDTAARRALDLLRKTLAASSPFADAAALELAVYGAWARLHGLVMLKADGFITQPLARFARSPANPDRKRP